MHHQFYMIKLNGWEKVIGKFNQAVADTLWNTLSEQLSKNEMFVNKNVELVEVNNINHYFLINARDFVSNIADEKVNVLMSAVHDLLGLTARHILTLQLHYSLAQESNEPLEDILNRMRPREYKLLPNYAFSHIDQILRDESIQSFLQPIFDLRLNRIAGYELLTRGPEQSPLFGADKLFSAAQNSGQSFELEYLCIKKGLSLLSEIEPHQFLTANINPNFLNECSLFDLVASAKSNPQLKLELTEHLPVKDWAKLRNEMNKYSRLNLEFWLDDAGCGYFGLETIEEVRPSVVKLCVNLIRHIETDDSLLPQLRNVVEKVHGMGSLILAEGVETSEQDIILRELGIDLVQGYYYAKPQRSDILLSKNVEH